MRIFLDECVDWRLSREFAGHEIKTARQMGWTALRNGELLALVSREFDVFVTVDGNLPSQQNIAALDLAVAILRARSARLTDLKPLVSKLLKNPALATPGRVIVVEAD